MSIVSAACPSAANWLVVMLCLWSNTLMTWLAQRTAWQRLPKLRSLLKVWNLGKSLVSWDRRLNSG